MGRYARLDLLCLDELGYVLGAQVLVVRLSPRAAPGWGIDPAITTLTLQYSGGDRAVADAQSRPEALLTISEGTGVLTLDGSSRSHARHLWDEGDRRMFDGFREISNRLDPV